MTVGSTRTPEHIDADAVVLAVPARPAARLLRHEVPVAAAELDDIDYASVAVVTLAYQRSSARSAARRWLPVPRWSVG